MDQVRQLLQNMIGADGAPLTGVGGQSTEAGGQGSSPFTDQNFDLQNLLQGKGGLATGAVAGGLAGLLLGGKKSRKFAGKALKIGGLAVAGGLAYKAWQNHQANKSAPTSAPQADRFLPSTPEAAESLSHHLIRAMIAAAKADGHISSEERQKIEAQLSSLEIGEAEKSFIARELSAPLDVGAVADAAQTPEEATEIYAASLLVIDPEGPAEKGYLGMLAARLGLEQGLVEELHREAEKIAE
ncbi:MAG: tellurite resistance TerB family protein [Pseudomonadota bacterium]